MCTPYGISSRQSRGTSMHEGLVSCPWWECLGSDSATAFVLAGDKETSRRSALLFGYATRGVICEHAMRLWLVQSDVTERDHKIAVSLERLFAWCQCRLINISCACMHISPTSSEREVGTLSQKHHHQCPGAGWESRSSTTNICLTKLLLLAMVVLLALSLVW